MYLSFCWFQSTFLSTDWHLSLPSGKGNQIFYLVRFYFCFIAVISIIIIIVFLNFNNHSPLHFENNSMKTFKGGTFVFVLVDQWIQLCFLKQEIIFHNVSGLAIPSLQWTAVLIG